ncbi:MAG: 2'-deoxycytidine 5'-triphosphate deaminase [Planctomycetes bacterium]|nr:2'-deoxycytidine 5'-triphosphate deaminase [Planctomycetota bacterium]
MSAPPKKNGILVDFELRALFEGEHLRSSVPYEIAQIQPASVDLRLGAIGHRVRAGFLPENKTVAQRCSELAIEALHLSRGAVLEPGGIYLILLLEEFNLPPDVSARSNPKSTTGRLDLFTRVLLDRNARFDDVPAGYRGPLYIEVAPRSFPVRVRTGDRLTQQRFFRGNCALSDGELRELAARETLAFTENGAPIDANNLLFDGDGGIAFRLQLSGAGPVGYRARHYTDVVDLSRDLAHDPNEFWDPVFAKQGSLIVEPEQFYIFSSKERLRVPPGYAAEMLPIDVGVGELRTNYAGFFDPGFGCGDEDPRGTPAILEVRPHDVPFLVDDGQVFFRLRFFRCSQEPRVLYGADGAGSHYGRQSLALARQFRPPNA